MVIGTGLVGASVGCALTRLGVVVHLADAVPSHAVVAASRGAGTTAPPRPADIRLVVVAVPPAALAGVISTALRHFPNAVVTDVGSVKGSVLAELTADAEVDLTRYVGGHPMAGSQNAGPLTANAELFNERSWVVCPNPMSSPAAIDVVKSLAREVGARVVQMPSAEHDEAVAKVSHLPQLMASLVGERLVEAPAEHLRLAGQGLRDVTRIAGSDPGLWRQIVAGNADAVRVELRAIAQALNEFVAVLDEPEAVERLVAAGRAGVRRLPGKHGLALASYARVDVEIPDTPGALAKLFAQIDASDINVEDLSIEHDDARQVGYLAVYVVPDRAGELAAAMSAAGWRLRP